MQTKGPAIDPGQGRGAAARFVIFAGRGPGHARPRFGLDAFAAFRRFNIRSRCTSRFLRMAPESENSRGRGSGPRALMAVLLGRGRSTSAYETAAGLPSDILDQAHVFGAASTDRIVARGNATRYVITNRTARRGSKL